jgi:hypothetical protein
MCKIIKNKPLEGRSSSLVGYGIGIAEVVGSNPTRSILITVLKYGSLNNNSDIGTMDSLMLDTDMDLDPYLLFVNAIRSPLTKQKYFGRLNSFFDYIFNLNFGLS